MSAKSTGLASSKASGKVSTNTYFIKPSKAIPPSKSQTQTKTATVDVTMASFSDDDTVDDGENDDDDDDLAASTSATGSVRTSALKKVKTRAIRKKRASISSDSSIDDGDGYNAEEYEIKGLDKPVHVIEDTLDEESEKNGDSSDSSSSSDSDSSDSDDGNEAMKSLMKLGKKRKKVQKKVSPTKPKPSSPGSAVDVKPRPAKINTTQSAESASAAAAGAKLRTLTVVDSDSESDDDIPLNVDRINGIDDPLILKARRAAAQLTIKTSRTRTLAPRTPRRATAKLKPIERVDVEAIAKAREMQEAAKQREEEELSDLEDDEEEEVGSAVAGGSGGAGGEDSSHTLSLQFRIRCKTVKPVTIEMKVGPKEDFGKILKRFKGKYLVEYGGLNASALLEIDGESLADKLYPTHDDVDFEGGEIVEVHVKV